MQSLDWIEMWNKILQKKRKVDLQKIFCISFQRTGTTSVAEFFKVNGYKVVDWSFNRYEWSNYYLEGNYEAIFNSQKFHDFEVFEDHPWFYQDFYKVLFHRFPRSKFVLFTRDGDKWFNSLVYLYKEMNDVEAKLSHFKIYGLEDIYYELIKDNKEKRIRLLINKDLRYRYINAYNFRNNQIIDFFKKNDSSRLIHLELNDDEKWQKMGEFFDIKDIQGLNTHENISV